MNLPDFIDRIEARIAAILQRLTGQTPRHAERIAMQAEVRQLLAQLDRLIPGESARIIQMAYDNSNDRTLKRVPRMVNFPELSNFSQIRQETLQVLADNLAHSLSEASRTVGRRSADVFRRVGLKQATENALRNLPSRFQAQVMTRELEQAGLTSFVDKSGRHWQLGTYSRMVIRTTTAEAEQRAVYNAVLGRGLDLVRIDRHEHPVDICTPFDGKTFSLTGKTPGYPVLKQLPPFHPNCTHNMLPAAEGLQAWPLEAAA